MSTCAQCRRGACRAMPCRMQNKVIAHAQRFANHLACSPTSPSTHQNAMKTLLFLLAIVAVTTARFEFTEEWELWKKVNLDIDYVRDTLLFSANIGTREGVLVKRGRTPASRHLGGQQELYWQPQRACRRVRFHPGHEWLRWPGRLVYNSSCFNAEVVEAYMAVWYNVIEVIF